MYIPISHVYLGIHIIHMTFNVYHYASHFLGIYVFPDCHFCIDHIQYDTQLVISCVEPVSVYVAFRHVCCLIINNK